MENCLDKEGTLYLTYDVCVALNGKRVLDLGCGIKAVSKFYKIAEAGIPGEINTELPFNFNALVRIRGKELMDMLNTHYPDVAEYANSVIEPEKEYVIDCYDMS